MSKFKRPLLVNEASMLGDWTRDPHTLGQIVYLLFQYGSRRSQIQVLMLPRTIVPFCPFSLLQTFCLAE